VRAALAEHLRGVVAQVLLEAGGGRLAARGSCSTRTPWRRS
jgi:hypothetical protein